MVEFTTYIEVVKITMNKKTFNSVILICCLVSLLGTSCKKDTDESKWNAVANVYVDNLPQEYNDLSEAVKESVSFYVRISNPSKDKEYYISLKQDNKYSNKMNVLPGTYMVNDVVVHSGLLGAFDATISEETLVVERNSESNLVVSLVNPEDIIKRIKKNMESQEILDAGLFSRKIQYGGNVYNMESLPEIMHFNYPSDKMLMHGEEMRINAEDNMGVAIIVKNTSEDKKLPPSQCECIGFEFFNISTVLPKGIKLGLPLDKIVNAKTGLAKTPNYCLGTPLIGMDLEDTTLVYIDEVSGDRMSIYFNAKDREVDSISYEFNRYQ